MPRSSIRSADQPTGALIAHPLADAGRVEEAIAPLADEMAIMGTVDCIGSIHYFVGLAHEAFGDPAAERAAYGLAIERNRRAHLKYWTERAERRLAGLSIRSSAG